MVYKEIIDNLSREETLLLLRTTSNNKVFYNDVIRGRTKIENIKLKLDNDEEFFPNNTIYDKNGKTRKVPHLIKIMMCSKEGTWAWINSVDKCDWDWFYATYYLLTNRCYAKEELYAMSEKQTIRNYKLATILGSEYF